MSNSEPRGEDLAATGEHRALGASELYAEWAARMQKGGRGRHSAISRMNTWSNYKNWSEKVRQSWESDVAPKKK
jgi:hypothetical protein